MAANEETLQTQFSEALGLGTTKLNELNNAPAYRSFAEGKKLVNPVNTLERLNKGRPIAMSSYLFVLHKNVEICTIPRPRPFLDHQPLPGILLYEPEKGLVFPQRAYGGELPRIHHVLPAFLIPPLCRF